MSFARGYPVIFAASYMVAPSGPSLSKMKLPEMTRVGESTVNIEQKTSETTRVTKTLHYISSNTVRFSADNFVIQTFKGEISNEEARLQQLD